MSLQILIDGKPMATVGGKAIDALTPEQKANLAYALADAGTAFAKARQKHAPMRGPHEGYAVLLEEVDELWAEVKRWQPDTDEARIDDLRKESRHVAAMALAFMIEAVS